MEGGAVGPLPSPAPLRARLGETGATARLRDTSSPSPRAPGRNLVAIGLALIVYPLSARAWAKP